MLIGRHAANRLPQIGRPHWLYSVQMAVVHLLMIAPAAPADHAAIRSWAALFFIVAVLLGVLLMGVVLVILANRLRRNRRRQPPEAPLADPWQSAGERIQVSKPRSED